MMRQPGDDAFSASSMDDSAYVSLPDAQRRRPSKPIQDAQFQYIQEGAFVEHDHQMMQDMFSPSVSTVSYQGHTDTSGFMLPPSSDGSISGDLGHLALSQGALWPVQAPTVHPATALSYPQPLQNPASVPRSSAYGTVARGSCGMVSPDGMPMNVVSQVPYMPSQSPELTGAVGIPSRTSSRATMSGYASAGSSGTPQQTPFTSTGNSASVPMLRQMSSGLGSTHYFDTGSVMSPASPVGIEQPHPAVAFHIPEDYSEYINLDQ